MDFRCFPFFLLFVGELVTNAVNRKDIARLARYRFYLVTDIFDVRVDGALVQFKRNPVHYIQQLAGA